MVNYKAKNCYYFAVKNLLELDSLAWLRGRKEAIINGDNDFQKALDDALNYQNIETHRERISKIKPYVRNIIRKGWNFQWGQKTAKKFEQNNKTSTLNVLFVPHNTETIRLHTDQNMTSVKSK